MIVSVLAGIASAQAQPSQVKRCLRTVHVELLRELPEDGPALQIGDSVVVRAKGLKAKEHVFLGRVWSHQHHGWRLLFFHEGTKTLRLFRAKEVVVTDLNGVTARGNDSAEVEATTGSVRTGKNKCVASTAVACLDYLWTIGARTSAAQQAHGKGRQRIIERMKELFYGRSINSIADQDKAQYEFFKSEGIKVSRIKRGDTRVVSKLKSHLRKGGVALVGFYDDYSQVDIKRKDFFRRSVEESSIPKILVPNTEGDNASAHQLMLLGLVRLSDGKEHALITDSFPKQGRGALFLWDPEEIRGLTKAQTGVLLLHP